MFNKYGSVFKVFNKVARVFESYTSFKESWKRRNEKRYFPEAWTFLGARIFHRLTIFFTLSNLFLGRREQNGDFPGKLEKNRALLFMPPDLDFFSTALLIVGLNLENSEMETFCQFTLKSIFIFNKHSAKIIQDYKYFSLTYSLNYHPKSMNMIQIFKGQVVKTIYSILINGGCRKPCGVTQNV